MKNNTSSELPYHNNYHLKCVCKFVLLGAEFYGLDLDEQKTLLTSALFHDIHHCSSGKYDDENIPRSVAAFLDYNKEYPIFNIDETKVIRHIECTRYTYLNDGSNLSLPEKIMRDADIVQGMFADDFINDICYGIAKEGNIEPETMLGRQESFYESIKFCTDWATDLYKKQLPIVMDKVNKELNKNKNK